jgi:beta-glucosidase
MAENKFPEGLASLENPIELIKQKSVGEVEERFTEDKSLTFPTNFLWGASTSSYQIEGNNSNSDWWQWEEKEKTEDRSGLACDSWNRWREDHELLSQLGVNAYRMSLEWSRIEPEEGKFSEEALDHYREILADLKKRNIKNIVTLWHWTSPIWFSEKYGFHKKSSVEKFVSYGNKIIDDLGDLIDVVVTFNEPMVPLGLGYLIGYFPPGAKNPWKYIKALNNIARSHRKVYSLIHKKRNIPVGITYLYNYYTAHGRSFLSQIANWLSYYFRISLLGKKIKGCEDYIGIDYYRLGRIIFDPKRSAYFGFRIEEDENNIMKWKAYPEGIYKVLKEVWEKNKLPIYIMENGMPDDLGIDDPQRIDFIKKHLEYVRQAMAEGVDVRGYCYWSLLDNYEWGNFHYRFGLVEMDYEKMERRPRKSFYAYQDIIKNNRI